MLMREQLGTPDDDTAADVVDAETDSLATSLSSICKPAMLENKDRKEPIVRKVRSMGGQKGRDPMQTQVSPEMQLPCTEQWNTTLLEIYASISFAHSKANSTTTRQEPS